MIIHKHKSDMFDGDWDVILSTTNCDGIQGAGIAKAMVDKFPDSDKLYKEKCEQRKVYPGNIIIHQLKDSRQIWHFPTKNRIKNKGRYIYITKGLLTLRSIIKGGPPVIFNENTVYHIPALGCGLSGLDWSIVEPLIVDAVTDLPGKFVIFHPWE